MSCSMSSVSDIKLIRTDTTLDLSQKAEKRYPNIPSPRRVVQGFSLGDMVVNMLSPGGLEPTVGSRY